MAPSINNINSRSWETLVLSIKKIPTKDRGKNPVPRKKFNRQQENNAIINT